MIYFTNFLTQLLLTKTSILIRILFFFRIVDFTFISWSHADSFFIYTHMSCFHLSLFVVVVKFDFSPKGGKKRNTTCLHVTWAPLCPPGERDAEDEGLQRRSHVDADHRAVHGRPPTGAVEATGDHHDWQVQAAVGRARYGDEMQPRPDTEARMAAAVKRYSLFGVANRFDKTDQCAFRCFWWSLLIYFTA